MYYYVSFRMHNCMGFMVDWSNFVMRSIMVDWSNYVMRSIMVGWSNYVMRSIMVGWSNCVMRGFMVDWSIMYFLWQMLSNLFVMCSFFMNWLFRISIMLFVLNRHRECWHMMVLLPLSVYFFMVRPVIVHRLFVGPVSFVVNIFWFVVFMIEVSLVIVMVMRAHPVLGFSPLWSDILNSGPVIMVRLLNMVIDLMIWVELIVCCVPIVVMRHLNFVLNTCKSLMMRMVIGLLVNVFMSRNVVWSFVNVCVGIFCMVNHIF